METGKKTVIIYGPTAIGKTSLGIELACRLDGEIISADSRQIYRGLDVGTGKDIQKKSLFYRSEKLEEEGGEERIGYYLVNGVRIWLLDVIDPDQQFTSYQWAKLAGKVAADIWRRGKLPLVVGGSAFYIKTLLDGLDTEGIGPDWRLRKELGQKPLAELQERLKRIWPAKWQLLNSSDKNNPRRLIRAIEVGGKQLKSAKVAAFGGQAELLAVKMTASLGFLKKRIKKRVKHRLEEGLKEEIEGLIGKGYSWTDPGMNTLAYKEFRPFFEKGVSLDQVCQSWLADEIRYAKRQLLWFRNDKRFTVVDAEKKSQLIDIHKKIEKWYHEATRVKGKVNHEKSFC